ncbi:MAG: toll/interleukin-1 receptor domain-containing protein [Hyphomonadaceae bacterium]|nr:toll/interleukin-1 receptor domain-containing protein [Hyphomonadaceae bacterium]
MADVFLSYAREDAARAEQVATALAAAGVEVFWDNEIPPGTTWADYIEAKLTQCKALIVLWSEHSTKSQWVREEARLGRDKGVLIPAMIDKSQAPFGFGEVQAANLSDWTGDQQHPGWRRFVEAVRTAMTREPRPQIGMSAPPRAAAAPTPAPPAAATSPPSGRVPTLAWVGGGIAALIAVLAIIGSFLPDQPAGTQPVATAVQPVATAVAPVQTQDYGQQVLDRLATVEQAFVQQGFQRVSDPVHGQLRQGEYSNTPATLEVGYDYRIIGVCDNDCADFNLILYDQNNVIVSQDVLTDATPIVSAAPQWSGPFTAQAVMQNCTVQPCYYALVLYGRPLQ